jgi:hypothetical protein
LHQVFLSKAVLGGGQGDVSIVVRLCRLMACGLTLPVRISKCGCSDCSEFFFWRYEIPKDKSNREVMVYYLSRVL